MTDHQHLAAALDRIADPSSGRGLVESGRLAAPRIADGIASAVLDVAGLSGDARARLQAEVEQAMRALPGVAEARLVLTAERRARRFVAVASGKGGVGKSTVAANLAVALAAGGREVGLIDADIHGPSVPTLFGSSAARATAVDKVLQPIVSHGVRTLSIGHMIDPSRAIAWRGPMVGQALKQLIEDADWGDADPILLDMPPGTGDIHITLAQRHKPAGAVIVSTPQDLALIDARRAIDLFNQLAVPIIGLVENMSGYCCPACGHVSDPFGRGGVEAACIGLGVPFLGRVPLDIGVREASDEGRPVALGDDPAAHAFREIAAAVTRFLED